MSRIRTIQVEKQNYAPSVEVKDVKPGLEMKRIKGYYHHVNDLEWTDGVWENCCYPQLWRNEIEAG